MVAEAVLLVVEPGVGRIVATGHQHLDPLAAPARSRVQVSLEPTGDGALLIGAKAVDEGVADEEDAPRAGRGAVGELAVVAEALRVGHEVNRAAEAFAGQQRIHVGAQVAALAPGVVVENARVASEGRRVRTQQTPGKRHRQDDGGDDGKGREQPHRRLDDNTAA